MAKGVPRREINELVKRWTLAKLPTILVEGPSDARLLKLIQKHSGFGAKFRSLDVYHMDLVDVPASMLVTAGFVGTGAKQRLLTFGAKVIAERVSDGFRCLADKDLDLFLNRDYRSVTVLYTDGSCMESYLWTPNTLALLIEICKCEGKIGDADVPGLFDSVTRACKALWAVRIVNERNRNWNITLHNSDQVLRVRDRRLELALEGYVERCQPLKGSINDVKAAVSDALKEIQAASARDVIQGHDLEWILTFVLRECSQLPRNALSQEFVAGALASLGARDPSVYTEALFVGLANWAEQVL